MRAVVLLFLLNVPLHNEHHDYHNNDHEHDDKSTVLVSAMRWILWWLVDGLSAVVL